MSAESLRIGNGRLLDLMGRLLPLGRIGAAGGVLDVAAQLLDIARQWAAVEESWGTAAGLKARLLLLVRFGEIVTARTPSPDDDALVAQLKVLVSNDAFVEFVASIIARFTTENPGAAPEGLLAFIERPDVHDSLAEAAVEKQLDFATIMEAIKLIIQLVSMFRGMGGGSAAPANGGAPPSNPWNF